VELNDVCKLKVASNDGHLVGSLPGIVEPLLLSPSEEKHACAAVLVVDCTDMKWGVSARIPRVHVRPVEQQVLEVLHHPVSTDLVNLLPALEVLRPDESVVVEQGFGHNRVCRVDYRVVDWGQALPVSVVWACTKFEHRPNRLDVVRGNGPVHRGGPVLSPIVEDCSTVHESHHHPGWPVSDPRN